MQSWEYLQVCFDHSERVWLDSQQRSGQVEQLSADVPIAIVGEQASAINVSENVSAPNYAALLNEFGAEGWELVGAFRESLLLKRPQP